MENETGAQSGGGGEANEKTHEKLYIRQLRNGKRASQSFPYWGGETQKKPFGTFLRSKRKTNKGH